MQYRSMPGSAERLSALGYGCMRLPTSMGGIDREKAQQQIWGAIDRGVNYLDTAYPYHMGASESFLGEHVLTNGYREKVNIATKLPCFLINRKESMEEIFSRQLSKLKVEQVDYYLLHSLDGASWDKMLSLGVTDFMDGLRRQGRVRHMGFSFHGAREDFMRIVDGYDWEFAQVQFNILDEHFQAGIEGIRYASGKGLGIIVMEPLRGGTLVGRIPGEVKKLFDAAPIQRSPVEWALRWVWNHPAVTVVLSGMNRDEHIEENLRIASQALPNSLTADESAIVESVRAKYLELMQVGCTGCAYCMPCPAGINIPSAFKYLNNYHMFSKMGARIQHIGFAGVRTTDGKPHWTNACLNCGQCEKKCPQGIAIRQEFRHVQQHLEGAGAKLLAGAARAVMNGRGK